MLGPLIAFAFVTSVTPGPNNIMLAASGANFGFRRSLPHMLGVTGGFTLLLLACCLGLGAVFLTIPASHTALKYLGAAYLLYLAYRIATASRAATDAGARPLSFLEAAGFQFANPKAWMMAVTAAATFTTVGGDLWAEMAVIALVFAMVNLPCIAVWTLFGVAIGLVLRTDRRLRAFNWGMAALTAATAVAALA